MFLSEEPASSRLGFIYALTSGVMPGIVKIGSTRKHPLTRAKELSAPTGVPIEFSLAFFQSFGDAFAAEALIHERFENVRVNEGREFFRVHVDEIIEFVSTLANSADYKERARGNEPDLVKGGATQRRACKVATPFAELFASFEDRGDGVLNKTEQAQCRALEASQ